MLSIITQGHSNSGELSEYAAWLDWVDDGGLQVTVTEGVQLWEAERLISTADKPNSLRSMSDETYMSSLKSVAEALLLPIDSLSDGETTGKYFAVVTRSEDDEDALNLIVKEATSISSSIKIVLFSTKLYQQKSIDHIAAGGTQLTLYKLISKSLNKQLLARLKQRSALELLREEVAVLTKEVATVRGEQDDVLDDMMRKFCLVLNTKKREIRDLREKVQLLGNEKEYSPVMDANVEKSPASETVNKKKPVAVKRKRRVDGGLSLAAMKKRTTVNSSGLDIIAIDDESSGPVSSVLPEFLKTSSSCRTDVIKSEMDSQDIINTLSQRDVSQSTSSSNPSRVDLPDVVGESSSEPISNKAKRIDAGDVLLTRKPSQLMQQSLKTDSLDLYSQISVPPNTNIQSEVPIIGALEEKNNNSRKEGNSSGLIAPEMMTVSRAVDEQSETKQIGIAEVHSNELASMQSELRTNLKERRSDRGDVPVSERRKLSCFADLSDSD